MIGLLIILVGLGWLGWRFFGFAGPAFSWLLRKGDDIGGWTMTFAFGGPIIKGAITRTAKVMLWAGAAMVALFVLGPGRALLGLLAVLVISRWRGASKRRAVKAKRQRAGFDSDAELKVLSTAVTQALTYIPGASTKVDQEMVPPRTYDWRKRPVRIGRKTVKGQWVYSCRVRPAPGKSIASLQQFAGKGLDADDDPIRDTVNNMLHHARGRDVDMVRRAGPLPTFVLSTMDQVTKRGGGKVGVGKLSLWTSDPFAVEVRYPYDPSKPPPGFVHFTDPVPIGVLRSNVEDRAKLHSQSSIQGANGSGKSMMMRPVLMAAAHCPSVVIICIALKGNRDFVPLQSRFAGGTIVTDPAVAASVLEAAHVEITRRNSLPKRQSDLLGHVLIALDEGQEMEGDIARIIPVVKLGRSALVWLWSITQYGLASIIPSEAAREMRQRWAGRIEGNLNQAQVTVGQRASKVAGPHLIPDDDRWVGVLFGQRGYVRVYRVTDKMLALCAAACPPRPADPQWFLDALASDPAELPPLELVTFPEDGAERAQSMMAKRFRVDAAPAAVQEACARVWALAGNTGVPVHSPITANAAGKVLDRAQRRLDQRAASDAEVADPDDIDAIELLSTYLTQPLTGATP